MESKQEFFYGWQRSEIKVCNNDKKCAHLNVWNSRLAENGAKQVSGAEEKMPDCVCGKSFVPGIEPGIRSLKD